MNDADPKAQNPSQPEPTEAGESAATQALLEKSSLLRQIFFERYFLAAVILMALFGVFLLAFIPKHFMATPPGVVPAYKKSGLDMLQAWSLARSAREKAAAGRISDSVLAWRSAIANDPGDPALTEGLVRTILDHPVAAREFLPIGVSQAMWLMQLTQTNNLSLDLAVAMFMKYSLDDYGVSLLAPRATNLTTVQAGFFLRGLYNLGRMDIFGESWARYSNTLAGDKEIGVYVAAWEAGWGPPGTISRGRAALEAAKNDPATRNLARQLSMPMASSLSDPLAYERELAALADDHADKVQDHLNFWLLLIDIGQSGRAAELARGFSRPPDVPAEAQLMTRILAQLGMKEYAAEYLQKHLPTFAFRPDLWELQGDLLIELKRWPELRGLAVAMRNNEYLPDTLAGYSWFLEGMAELRTGRKEAALQAFTRAADSPTTDPLLSFRVSNQLTDLGYPTLANKLLKSLEETYGGRAYYWLAVVAASYEAREFDTMRAAAARGYQLSTNEPVFINNYAAMLLMQRTNPALAIQLTLQTLTARPSDPGAQLNHAIALIQNGRFAEAEELLGEVRFDALDSRLVTVRNYAYFDLFLSQGDKARALDAYKGIETRFLFAPQLRWLEQAYLKATKPEPAKQGAG